MLPDLVLDFETRSRLNLKKVGAYRYAEDYSTQVTIASYAIGNSPVYRWRPLTEPPPLDLVSHIIDGGRVVAHGPFERIIWNGVLLRYFPHMPKLFASQTSDLMVRAFNINLPGSLEQLAKVLGIGDKDMAGHALMLKLSKPRRVLQDGGIVWWDDPELMLRQEDYCDRDVTIERQAHVLLPELPADEHELWLLDQEINDTGIPQDIELVKRADQLAEYAKRRADQEISNMTNGAVNKATEVGKLVAWLNSQHVKTNTLRKGDREYLLAMAELLDNQEAVDVIELRSTAGKTSTSKFKAIQASVCADGTIKGTLQFMGAQQTKRWAGRVVQPQNYMRVSDDPEPAVVAWIVGMLKDQTYLLKDIFELIELYGPPRLANGDPQEGMATLSWLAKCMRSTVAVSAPDEMLVGGDFSNIEGRINAWLSDEYWKLMAFKEYDNQTGPDLYKLTFSKSFGIAIEEVTKAQRQIGKVIELACGYQGGVGAFVNLVQTYLLKLPDLCKAIHKATDIDKWESVWEKYQGAKDKHGLDRYMWTAVKIAVLNWRRANLEITQSWWELADAAIKAVEHPNQPIPVYGGKCHYVSNQLFLYCFLPHGGTIMYARPHIQTEILEQIWNGTQYVETSELFPWELDELIERGYRPITRKSRRVWFFGLSDTKHWVRKYLYGGYQAENIVQSVARCFMTNAMLKAKKSGFSLCLTVHDELLAWVKANACRERAPEFEAYFRWLLMQNPTWAPDFPMAASVWSGDRYTK